MTHLLKVSLSSIFLLISTCFSPIFAGTSNFEKINLELENAFNRKKLNTLENLISKDALLDIQKKYKDFIARFPDAQWSIKPAEQIKENSISLEVLIEAKKEIGSEIYTLTSNQKIALKTSKEKILSYQVNYEYSILKSIDSDLIVSTSIPDKVLTGSRYNADIILENPLGDNYISGGILINGRDSKSNQAITIEPLSAGGLFKSIQAPLIPINQNIEGLIVHPKGIISVTKMVRIIPDIKEVNL